MIEVTFLWFRILLMLTASRSLFLKSSFRKSRVGVSSGETILNGLVQPKLSNIQNDCNQVIFRRIWNVCFCILYPQLPSAKSEV